MSTIKVHLGSKRAVVGHSRTLNFHACRAFGSTLVGMPVLVVVGILETELRFPSGEARRLNLMKLSFRSVTGPRSAATSPPPACKGRLPLIFPDGFMICLLELT
ncbi:hypothetical protein [Deinococcus sp. UYEF24]